MGHAEFTETARWSPGIGAIRPKLNGHTLTNLRENSTCPSADCQARMPPDRLNAS